MVVYISQCYSLSLGWNPPSTSYRAADHLFLKAHQIIKFSTFQMARRICCQVPAASTLNFDCLTYLPSCDEDAVHLCSSFPISACLTHTWSQPIPYPTYETPLASLSSSLAPGSILSEALLMFNLDFWNWPWVVLPISIVSSPMNPTH